jgi:hypothetical protein
MSTTTYSSARIIPAQDLRHHTRIIRATDTEIQWLTVSDVLQDADPRFVTIAALGIVMGVPQRVEWTSWGGLRYAALTPGECAHQAMRVTTSPCATGLAVCAAHRGQMLRLHSSIRR